MRVNKQMFKSIAAATVDHAFVFGGLSLVAYGAYLIYQPSAFIVVGSALFWMGLPERHE